MENLRDRIARLSREEIQIVPYDPRWPDLFQSERDNLLTMLPRDLILRIEHFGSTSIPGMSSKPIVDMLVEVRHLEVAKEHVAPLLESLGYDYLWRPTFGEDVPPFYAWFIKRDAATKTRTHHIHMIGNTAEFSGHWDALRFRDYVRAHPDVAREYEAVKRRAAAAYPNDRAAYTAAKSDFINRITAMATSVR